MRRETIKFSLVFIICLMLLIGCGKDIMPEEQPDTLSENAGQSVPSDSGQAQNLSENEAYFVMEKGNKSEKRNSDTGDNYAGFFGRLFGGA